MTKKEFLYFQIAKDRQEYKGVRFFRMHPMDFTIVQVVVHPGEEKKGRGHSLGVMTLSKLTLYSNYLAMGYAIPCTRKQYEDAFNKVIELLKGEFYPCKPDIFEMTYDKVE